MIRRPAARPPRAALAPGAAPPRPRAAAPVAWAAAPVAWAAAAAAACAPSYVPANAPPLVLTGESYVKCGAPYARDLLGSNLLPLVEGDPVATKYARAARDYQLWALGADVASGLAGVAGFVVALRDDAGQNATAAQVLLNASIALAVLGPVLHVRASDRELDAVNAYNDRTAPARRRPPGAAGEGVPPPPCDERPAARAPGPPPPSPAGAP